MIEADMTEDTSVIQLIINDLKSSSPLWEDFVSKGLKLHASLRSTAATLEAFLDTMLKIADAATSSKGAAKDVGASLTKMVIRHRSIEQKLRVLSGLFGDNLIIPLQEKIDEWKKSVHQFDKDNAKEFKKAKQDLKKVGMETIRLHKKVNKKGKFGQKDRLEAVMKMASAQHGVFEEHQKRALRKVLVEERSRYCILLNLLQPVVEQEVSLLSDAENLSSLLEETSRQCEKPGSLPEAGELMIEEFKTPDVGLFDDQITPPASPTNYRRHAYSVSGTSSRSNSPPSRVSSPDSRPLSRSKSMSAATSKPAPPVRRSSVLSPSRESCLEKNLGMSRLSVSSQSSTSNQSNYSSMSSLDSQSVDNLPPPPAQVLPPAPNPCEEVLPPPPSDAVFSERARQKSWTVDSGVYSSTSSSLDRSPSASLAQVPYDDNDSGHYEPVPYNNGGHVNADLSSERFYENPQFFSSVRPHRSNSESLGIRNHGVHFAKRSISCNESETSVCERTDMMGQHSRRTGLLDNRGMLKSLDVMKSTELSAQIAANAAEVAAHFQRKDESHEKWRPPVAKKTYLSTTSPVKSTDRDRQCKQMENPRKGIDNEFLDENYKVTDGVSERQNSLLSQIQRQRSVMNYVHKQGQ